MSPRGGLRKNAGRPRKRPPGTKREQWTFVPDDATRAAVEAYRTRAMPGASTAAVVRALVLLGARGSEPSDPATGDHPYAPGLSMDCARPGCAEKRITGSAYCHPHLAESVARITARRK